MIHIRQSLSKRSSLILSAIILTLPVFCWFSIFMYVVFDQTYFMDEIFSKIDTASSLVTIFIMVGLPALAIFLINLPYIDFTMGRSNSALEGKFKFDINSKALFISSLSILLMIIAVLASFRNS